MRCEGGSELFFFCISGYYRTYTPIRPVRSSIVDERVDSLHLDDPSDTVVDYVTFDFTILVQSF